MTIDELFRRTLARAPDALALIDPPNKPEVCARLPMRLSYAQADRAIASLVAGFKSAGLPPGSIVAVQLPNTVEAPLTLLAAWHAGLTVALIPQLWREAEVTEAMNRISACAIVTMCEIDGVNHADVAMNAAVGAFSVRHVFGFGDDVPDGMTPLQITPDELTPDIAVAPPASISVITFDVTPDGPRIVPRTHLQLISGGLAVALESEMPQGVTMLSTILPCSFAGVSAGLMPWLLGGGALCLHHPFDDATLGTQLSDEACTVFAAPGALTLRLDAAGVLAGAQHLRQVIGLWRSPEDIASSARWQSAQATLTDLYVFGEAGLFGAQRGDDGKPAALRKGVYSAPRHRAGASAGEIFVTPGRTLALRSGMVVPSAYSDRDEPLDYVDTQYAAKADAATGVIQIGAPPPGVLAVGGYRFLARDLQAWSERLAAGSTLTPLPDPLNTHRLAGHAPDNSRARAALAELGLNPLMVEAFRAR